MSSSSSSSLTTYKAPLTGAQRRCPLYCFGSGKMRNVEYRCEMEIGLGWGLGLKWWLRLGLGSGLGFILQWYCTILCILLLLLLHLIAKDKLCITVTVRAGVTVRVKVSRMVWVIVLFCRNFVLFLVFHAFCIYVLQFRIIATVSHTVHITRAIGCD